MEAPVTWRKILSQQKELQPWPSEFTSLFQGNRTSADVSEHGGVLQPKMQLSNRMAIYILAQQPGREGLGCS